MKRTTQISDKFRQFGEHGPGYEILALIGEDFLRGPVVESGEELNYPLDQGLKAPIVD